MKELSLACCVSPETVKSQVQVATLATGANARTWRFMSMIYKMREAVRVWIVISSLWVLLGR